MQSDARKQFDLGVLICMLILIFGFLLNGAINLLLARWLSADCFGDFSVVKSVANAFAPLLLLGGADAITRFIPTYIAEKNWSLSKGYLLFFLIFGISLVLFGASFVAFYIILCHIEAKQFLLDAHPYLFCLWIIPLFAVSIFLSKVIRSLNKPVLSVLPQAAVLPVIFVIFVFFYTQTYSALHLYDVILFFGLATIVTIGIQALIFFLAAPKQIIQKPSSFQFSYWVSIAWKLMVLSLIMRMLLESDIIFLEIFGPSEQEVGIFAIIITIASLPWIIHQAIIVVFSPKISPLQKAQDHAGLQRLLYESTTILIVLEVLCFIVLLIFGDRILGWFGSAYQQAYYPLLWVLIAFLISTITSMPLAILQFGDGQSALFMPIVAMFVVNIVLNIALVPWFGIYGTVASLLVVRPALSLWAMIVAQKKFNFF